MKYYRNDLIPERTHPLPDIRDRSVLDRHKIEPKIQKNIGANQRNITIIKIDIKNEKIIAEYKNNEYAAEAENVTKNAMQIRVKKGTIIDGYKWIKK